MSAVNIEVGYLPKSYYDRNPSIEGFFPFALEGEVPYVFSIGDFYLPECDERFLPLWMKNIQAYPLYVYAEVPFYWQEEFEHFCKVQSIPYRYLGRTNERLMALAEVKTQEQFQQIVPFYITLGSGNDVVLWSNKQDAFRVEPREWKGLREGAVKETLVVSVEADTSVFWIGHDANDITVLSTHSYFSTYEKISETFPDFVIATPCEYE